MLLRNIVLLTLIVGQVAVYACLGPENVFGINFTDGESIDVSVIERLGEEGVNYNKNVSNGMVTYSFRSHYNQSIMVEVTTRTDPALKSGVLTFTVDTSAVSMTDLPFGPCVRTELDWLVEAGVISVDRVVRERIEQAFDDYKDPFNTEEYETITGFFWTKQDSLLPNNMSFQLDGIVAMAQRCGDIAFAQTDLPPQPLDIVVRIVTKDTKKFSRGHVDVSPDHSAMLVVDIRGRMHRQLGPAGLMSHRSGILLGFDRRSGAVKRVVTLP